MINLLIHFGIAFLSQLLTFDGMFDVIPRTDFQAETVGDVGVLRGGFSRFQFLDQIYPQKDLVGNERLLFTLCKCAKKLCHSNCQMPQYLKTCEQYGYGSRNEQP